MPGAVLPAFFGAAVSAGVTAAGWGAFAASLAGGLAAAGISTLTAPRAGMQAIAASALDNGTSNTEPIPVIYGTRRVGMTRVFTESTDGSVFAHEFLHMVCAICEGEVDAIDTVYLDEVASTNSRFTGLVTIEKYTGTDDQAASSALIAALPGSPTGRWTTNHRGRGVAYAYIKLKWSQDAFPQGLPQITFDVDGKKVWDPRLGSPTVTQWSDNPALCILDYLMNSRYGRGIPASSIDVQSFQDAADYCDELVQVPNAVGSPSFDLQKRYTCNGLLVPEQGWMENVRALESSCRGHVVFAGGKWRLVLDKAETPISFAFTEDNICGGWSFRKGGKGEKFNRVRARFFNSARRWEEDFGIYDDATDRANSDQGELLEQELSLPFTSNVYMAKRLAQLEQQASRYPLTAQFTAMIEGLRCEVGDVVNITHSTPGWDAKPFRIERIGLLNTDEVVVSVREYQAGVYDLDAQNAVEEAATSLPDAFEPSAPTGLTFTQHPTVWDTATLSWDSADNDDFSYQVEFKLSTDSEYTVIPRTSDTTLEVTKLRARRYDFRVKAVNNVGVSSDYATDTFTLTGPLIETAGSLSGIGLLRPRDSIVLSGTPLRASHALAWAQPQNLVFAAQQPTLLGTFLGGVDSTIDVVNPVTDEVVHTFSIPGSPPYRLFSIDFCPANGKLYVQARHTGSNANAPLFEIDPSTMEVTAIENGSPATLDSTGTSGTLFCPLDSKMYFARVTEAGIKKLSILDPATGLLEPEVEIESSDTMVYCPHDGFFYMFLTAYGSPPARGLLQLDPLTRTLGAFIPLTPGGGSGGMVYCQSSNRIYVVNPTLRSVDVVNPEAAELVATFSILDAGSPPNDEEPSSIVYSPLTDLLYVVTEGTIGSPAQEVASMKAVRRDTHQIIGASQVDLEGTMLRPLWVPSVKKFYVSTAFSDSCDLRVFEV